MNLIKKLIREEEGQGLVEYALIVGLIALAAVVALNLAGQSVSDLWNKIAGKLGEAGTAVDGTKITTPTTTP